MSGGCYKFYPETSKVKSNGVKDIGVSFAGVATSCTNLSKVKRPTKYFFEVFKIFEGKIYGFGDRAKRIKQKEIKQSTEEEILDISNLAELETVKKVRLNLIKNRGVGYYKSWIKPCSLDVKQDGFLVIKAKTIFHEKYLEIYSQDIVKATRGIFPGVTIGNNKIPYWERERQERRLTSEMNNKISIAEAIQALKMVCNVSTT